MLDCEGTRSHYDNPTLVTAEKATRDKLNELDRTIRAALEDTYRAGLREGRSILLQLAGGDLSMNDFNKQSTD